MDASRKHCPAGELCAATLVLLVGVKCFEYVQMLRGASLSGLIGHPKALAYFTASSVHFNIREMMLGALQGTRSSLGILLYG
jgi:hypothetical protein